MEGKYKREALATIERIINENLMEPDALLCYAGRSGAFQANVSIYAAKADYELSRRHALIRNQDIWFREFSRLASHEQMLGLMRNINRWLLDNPVNGGPMVVLDDQITEAEDALHEMEAAE